MLISVLARIHFKYTRLEGRRHVVDAALFVS